MASLQNEQDIEKTLAELYSQMFADYMGMPESEARTMAQQMLDVAKKKSEEQGSSRLRPDFGNLLLQHEATDPRIHRMLERARREGATNKDIEWWWNLQDLDRRMAIESDNAFRLALFNAKLETGAAPEEAAAAVRRRFPMYGNPGDTAHGSGDDTPLPYELKNRINIWRMKQELEDPGGYQKRQGEASSFNALVRAAIGNGEL